MFSLVPTIVVLGLRKGDACFKVVRALALLYPSPLGNGFHPALARCPGVVLLPLVSGRVPISRPESQLLPAWLVVHVEAWTKVADGVIFAGSSRRRLHPSLPRWPFTPDEQLCSYPCFGNQRAVFPQGLLASRALGELKAGLGLIVFPTVSEADFPLSLALSPP